MDQNHSDHDGILARSEKIIEMSQERVLRSAALSRAVHGQIKGSREASEKSWAHCWPRAIRFSSASPVQRSWC